MYDLPCLTIYTRKGSRTFKKQNCELQFLADSMPLQLGERIATSGHGGVFPSGIPIGVVTQVNHRGAEIELFADFDRLEYVRVLRYHPPRLYEDDGTGPVGLATQ